MARTVKQRAGDDAEGLVAVHLAERGWAILGRNTRVGRAELDIVAVDPGPPAALVVVEVRRRGRRDFGLAEETVDHRKRARLWAAACAVVDAGALPDDTPIPRLPLRLDLIAIEPRARAPGWNIRHHRWLGRR
jgi:putative endonuclease